MITRSQLTEIGRFNHPHGINGEISAIIDQDVDVESLKCIVVEFDGINVPFFINSVRPKSAAALLLDIDGVDDEIQASRFANKPIYALADDPAIENSEEAGDGLYASDLIGFRIVSDDGALDGEITDIDDNTANVLFVVETENRGQVLIPVADELIESIDEDNHTITVSLPEGILDI